MYAIQIKIIPQSFHIVIINPADLGGKSNWIEQATFYIFCNFKFIQASATGMKCGLDSMSWIWRQLVFEKGDFFYGGEKDIVEKLVLVYPSNSNLVDDIVITCPPRNSTFRRAVFGRCSVKGGTSGEMASISNLTNALPLHIRRFRPCGYSSSLCTLSCSLAEEVDPKPPIPKPNSYFPKRGQTLELMCESLAFKGKGLCKVTETGFVVLCDRALPGEHFIGRVTRKKGNYAEVTKVKTITPPRDIVDAPCVYAPYCGGCKTQNLSYEAQVRAKEEQVRDLLIHVGRFSGELVQLYGVMKPIVPCDIQFHYRNKMEFSFGPQRWLPRESLHERRAVDADNENENFALGLHAPGFFDKILNVDKCLLQSHPANKVLAAIQECWRDPQLGFSPYDVHSHKGFLKHLMLRSGRDVTTGQPEVMVNFVSSSYKPDLLKFLVDKVSAFPEVVSVVNNVNTSVGNTSVGEEEYTLYGKSSIRETLRGLTFQISANSFFQTNTYQAEVLYKLIEDCAGVKGDGSEIVLDLFCGTGTIGLTLARRVSHVYGYEVVPQAIADACLNAKINGIQNATFIQGDLNKIDENFGKNFPKPDIVISDPNRPGMHMKLIKFLLNLKAPRIVYVSCNPATCARDLDFLCHGVAEQNINGCYKLISLQPVDMFPHTPHIECVCLLELQ